MPTPSPIPDPELTAASIPRAVTPGDNDTAPRSYGKSILVAVVVGLFINTLVGALSDYRELLDSLSRFRIGMLLVPFFCIILVYFIDSIRYRLVFHQFGITLAYRDALYNNILGYFISGITPSSAGGQPFQVYHFAKLGLDSTAATNIVFSRLMVSNLAQLAVVTLFIKQGIRIITAAANGIFILGLGLLTTLVISCVLFLLFVRPTLLGTMALGIEGTKLGHFISRRTKDEHWAEKLSSWSFGLRDSFRYLWAGKTPSMLLDLLLFAADQVIWAYSLYYPMSILTGVYINFGGFLFAFILCGLVSAYIPTPGASGSIEAAYALVLGGVTNAPGAALSAIIFWRAGAYYLHLLLGGIVYSLVPIPKGCYEKLLDGRIKRIRHHHGV